MQSDSKVAHLNNLQDKWAFDNYDHNYMTYIEKVIDQLISYQDMYDVIYKGDTSENGELTADAASGSNIYAQTYIFHRHILILTDSLCTYDNDPGKKWGCIALENTDFSFIGSNRPPLKLMTLGWTYE